MTKTLLSTLAAAALLFGAAVANAADSSGRIAEIDREAQTLTLDNGMTFTLSEDVNMEGLAAGQEVKVTYETQDGENIASEVGRSQN